MVSHLKKLLWLPVFLLVLSQNALAQSDEQVSTTTYKDWVVRCIDRTDLPPCDAVQTAFDTQTQERVMLTSIAHFGGEEDIGVQIWVPTGLLVSGGVLLEVDQTTQALNALKFTRCETDGCFIEAIVSEADLDPLKKGNQAAIAVLSSTGEPRIVGLSLSGFTKAFEEVKRRNTKWLEANS
ncbi:MAG: invasion associated locus B family protein [Candidatus Puniceispirillaceae bacterium]